MPYIVLVGGGIAIVFIWLNFAKKRGDRESSARALQSAVGTIAIAWAMWSWGVTAIQEESRKAADEEVWLATFVDKHRQEWDADCRAILTSLGARGIIYDPQTGAGYDLNFCQSMWTPPQRPVAFSTSEYEQPGRVPPFPSSVLFGVNASEIRCVDAALTECYEWIDFRGGPG